MQRGVRVLTFLRCALNIRTLFVSLVPFGPFGRFPRPEPVTPPPPNLGVLPSPDRVPPCSPGAPVALSLVSPNLLHPEGAPCRVGGRLILFKDVWLAHVDDSWVRDVVSFGYKIEFSSLPRDRFFLSRPPRSPPLAAAFEQALQSLISRGVLVQVPLEERFKGFYSNLFIVPKKDGSVRPILDLKLLNRQLRITHFRMESLRSVIASLESNEFFASVDIQDAYLHVPIFPPHQRFLRFAVGSRHFQFVALPFGLATAPRVFSKVMAAVMAILRVRGISVTPYLDDILIKAPSQVQCCHSVQITLDTLTRFGWLLNRSKSCLLPSQSIQFLGMRFDSARARVYLPADKLLSLQSGIRTLRRPRPVSIRFCMRILGKMVAALEAVPFAQFHTRPLQLFLLSRWDKTLQSLDRMIRLPPQIRSDLRWWLRSPLLSLGRSFLPIHWSVVTTDASLQGWGGVWQGRVTQGVWSPQESILPINLLELRAIRLSLLHWQNDLHGLPVRIQTDNATAVAYINRQGGTRSSSAMAEVALILEWAELHVPALSAVHIPGVENWTADFLSRVRADPGEWALHPEVFNQLCLRWGLPDVDLMASRQNRQVPTFVSRSSDPLALGTDALVIPWRQFSLPYLFPPLPLLPRVLRKVKAEGVPVILIAPDWPRRAWYSDLVNLSADTPWRLPDRPDLLSQGPLCHPHFRYLHLTAWLLKPGS